MNLREQAEADNVFLLEDSVFGFASTIKFTDLGTPPTSYTVQGQYLRIGIDINPETGLTVAGNKSSVTVRLTRFPAGKYPDEGWLVECTDILGTTVKGKIATAMNDKTLGRGTYIIKR